MERHIVVGIDRVSAIKGIAAVIGIELCRRWLEDYIGHIFVAVDSRGADLNYCPLTAEPACHAGIHGDFGYGGSRHRLLDGLGIDGLSCLAYRLFSLGCHPGSGRRFDFCSLGARGRAGA